MHSFFFWKSFSFEYFSGKFEEIWAKILRTHHNFAAPTPMFHTLSLPCFHTSVWPSFYKVYL